MKAKKFKLTQLLLMLAACIATLLPASCTSSPTALTQAIEDYADAEIAIVGLTDAEFMVTPRELVKLGSKSTSGSGQSAKAGTVNATGPTLTAFIESYGKSPSDFKLVRFIAADEYRVTLHERTLRESEVILSIANGGKPLAESERPMRLFSPDLESSQWVYSVVRIEFVPTEG